MQNQDLYMSCFRWEDMFLNKAKHEKARELPCGIWHRRRDWWPNTAGSLCICTYIHVYMIVCVYTQICHTKVHNLWDLANMRIPQGICRSSGSEKRDQYLWWSLFWQIENFKIQRNTLDLSQYLAAGQTAKHLPRRLWEQQILSNEIYQQLFNWNSEVKNSTWKKETVCETVVHQTVLLSSKNCKNQAVQRNCMNQSWSLASNLWITKLTIDNWDCTWCCEGWRWRGR